MKSTIYRFRFLILALVLGLLSIIIISVLGREYTFTVNNVFKDVIDENFYVQVENGYEEYIEVLDYSVDKDKPEIKVTVRGKKPGMAYVEYSGGGLINFYVHPTKIVTIYNYFGQCGGSRLVSVFWLAYIFLILLNIVFKYRNSMRENMFRYHNILYLGLIIYMLYAILVFTYVISYGGGLDDYVSAFMNSISSICNTTLPVIILLTIIVSISNIKLMKREGINWRNMLGFILGIALCLGVLVPDIIEHYMKTGQIIDVYKETGIGRFIEMAFTTICGSVVSYIECILIGTIILAIRVARHTPKEDQDYVLILGCMIKKDGSLTKLLKGRADKAIEYSKIQKKRSDKDIIFVPSGGQGSDEIISEGEAIKNYLISEGIDESHILLEDKSTSTEENLKFSKALIDEHYKANSSSDKEAKIAFSTTNYHVLRAGMLATSMGIRATGLGARTVSYFWINAFIREFIATLVVEKKRHVLVIGMLLLISILSVIYMYVSSVILS
ncbi:MAG: YdcF family protein [Lachnospiraceae bacterium]|nr:YdcF family protein [Lachnospiraceae bacterium]